MSRLPMPRSQRWLMAAFAVLMPVMLFVTWGLQLDENLPEPWNSVLMLLNPALGIVALVLLPRVLYRDSGAPDWAVDPVRERRALGYGVVVVLLSGVSGSALLPGVAAVVSLAIRRRAAWVAAAAGSFLGAVLVSAFTSPTSLVGRWEVVVMAPWIVAVPIVFGLYRGGRRELLRSLRGEADAARRRQEALEERARQEERTEIAREMHDTVSHRLALVALHAGALEYRDDLTAEQVREAAAVIRRGAQDAADELSATLHVLRTEPADARPAATLADLDALVEEVRATGTPVAFTLRGATDEAPPPAVAAHLYRVLREALTNATKHAPGLEVTVEVDVIDGEGARLRVSNPLVPSPVAAPGSRLGLVGLRERMALAGGRLEAGPSGDRFELEAWVPWRG